MSSKINQEFRFKPDDFESLEDPYQGATKEDMAKKANSLLDEYLKTLPMVYLTHDGWSEMSAEKAREWNHNESALLWGVKEINK